MHLCVSVKEEGERQRGAHRPLMFQILIEPSLDAVIICSEFGEKHNQVTALWTLRKRNKKMKRLGTHSNLKEGPKAITSKYATKRNRQEMHQSIKV